MDIGLGNAGITLESRFADLDQPVLLTGIQALLRLLLEQRRLDMAAGPSARATWLPAVYGAALQLALRR